MIKLIIRTSSALLTCLKSQLVTSHSASCVGMLWIKDFHSVQMRHFHLSAKRMYSDDITLYSILKSQFCVWKNSTNKQIIITLINQVTRQEIFDIVYISIIQINVIYIGHVLFGIRLKRTTTLSKIVLS